MGCLIIQVADGGDIRPGQPDMEGARCALDSLEMAVGLTRSGATSALVTGPGLKIAVAGHRLFSHPGQTEFIAERCGMAKDNVVMMLAGPSLARGADHHACAAVAMWPIC
jgi:4-hydroxythreonine-4-phosphate dehydrogenase